MAPSGRFALALALCVALAVAATAGAISLSLGREALQLDELLQVERPPEGPPNSLDEHLAWTFEIFGGERRWTEADLQGRFTSGFSDGFDVVTLNDGLDELFAERGPLQFHRMMDRGPSSIRALAVGEDGTPLTIWLAVDEERRIESLTLDEVASPARLPSWQATLIVLALWAFLIAGAAAARLDDTVRAWVLLAAAPLAGSAILVLAGSQAAYSGGRLLPPLLVPVAIWLLTRSVGRQARRSLVGLGVAAALIGFVAPLTREASLIAHPSLYGSIVDSERAYRVLNALSFGVAAAAFVGVAAAALAALSRAPRQYRTHHVGVAVVAIAWGVGAAGSSIDFAVAAGHWAGGALAAVIASAQVSVPVVAMMGIVVARLDRPGLARLVIDLEAAGSRLDAAVASALEDPTLQVLISPDGQRVTSQEGAIVDPDDLGPARVLTEIRSGARLVGALVHDASLRHEPERLQAVAAAAGLALEVDRLNQQVTAQLEEVSASRARIVQASDTARRQVERDLHDGAQQRLVALGLMLQRARRQARSGRTDGLPDLLDQSIVEVRDTIEEVRAVSRGAQPALLAERGLAVAVDALAERASVPVDIDIDVGTTTDPLPANVESTAYYVIAEGLTNVAKHARATSASVSVSGSDGLARIRIADDGSGGAAAGPGSGLEGLNDRVVAAGGTFRIASTSGGTTLEVTLPCG